MVYGRGAFGSISVVALPMRRNKDNLQKVIEKKELKNKTFTS
jgi:hypothetical protein